jgi:hypothetical protein
VAAIRQGELRRACEHLGVSDLELLGYHDSGMAGWGLQHRENAFCGVAVEHAASRIAQLIDHYQPQVVVTYDPGRARRGEAVLQGPRKQLFGSSLAGKLPASQFRYAFGAETYIRARDTTGTFTPENDLFAGLGNPQLQFR